MKRHNTPHPHVSPVNDALLAAVGKLTAEYGKIGGNLNQITRFLNECAKFAFEWEWFPASGLSVKDFISPTSFDFGETRTFRMGKMY